MIVVINKLNNIVLGPHASTRNAKHFTWSKPEPHHYYIPNKKTHAPSYNPTTHISCDSSILANTKDIITEEKHGHCNGERRTYTKFISFK